VDLDAWAATTAEQYLSRMGRRWAHVRSVAQKARVVASVLAEGDAEMLVPAAFLHDVGYAPPLAVEGFHPLDGGRFVREAGHERLARLIAHHSGARREAQLRGYATYVTEFTYEDTLLDHALTYCDMTTGPDGRPTVVAERIAEIVQRYGPEHITARAISDSEPEFLDIERRIDALLNGQRIAGAAPER
jgi:predicted HD phosphohydrolase